MITQNIKGLQVSTKEKLLMIETDDGTMFGVKLKRILDCMEDNKETSSKEPFDDFKSSVEKIGQELFNAAATATEKISETRTEFLKNLKKWVDEELKKD